MKFTRMSRSFSKFNFKNKIVNSKFQPIDIIREICGVGGADYIESKIDNNK